eukprot:gene26093-31510_t
MASILILALLLGTLTLAVCQRNAKEEAICAPFLTSHATSPLILNLVRNLTIDEEGEFACELVLQDRFLPNQIRLTIHEGLCFLAARHVQMGLHKASSAFRHADILTEIMPKHADFRVKAGTWAIHADVARYEAGASHFFEALYGKASTDSKLSDQLRYEAYRGYVKALSALGRLAEAFEEIIKMLDIFPYDFEAVFMLKDNLSTVPVHLHAKAHQVIRKAEALYQVVRNHISSQEKDAPSLELTKYHTLPSTEEFWQHIHRREPFVISFPDVPAMSSALGWNVDHWLEDEYVTTIIRSKAGEGLDGEYLVLTEQAPQLSATQSDCHVSNMTSSSGSCLTFGHGLFLLHESRDILKLLKAHREAVRDSSEQHQDTYINVQLPGTGHPPYHPPLQHLQDDLPLSHELFSVIAGNVTDVNLWMGLLAPRPSLVTVDAEGNIDDTYAHSIAAMTTSKLHRDALDNMYAVLEGRKQFKLWRPSAAFSIPTLSPSIAVHKDGLSFQLAVHKLREMLLKLQPTLAEDLPEEHQNGVQTVLADLLSSPAVDYDTESLHFAAENNTFNAFSLPNPTFIVDLQPGELLYLPTGWYHHVSSMAAMPQHRHMAINIWWRALHWQDAVDYEHKELLDLAVRIVDKAIGATAA